MEEYDIYIRGFAMRDDEPPELGLRRVFGLDAVRARELVLSLPRVVKRRVPAAHVPSYERALRDLGAEYELRLSALRPREISLVGAGVAPAAREDDSGLLTLPPEAARPPAALPGVRFAQTVVGNLDPAAVAWPGAASARTEVTPAPEMTLPPGPAPSSVPSPQAVHDPRPSTRAAQPSGAPRSGRAQAASERPFASGWISIKPAYPNRPQDAGDVPPPPPTPTNLGLGGRPDWLMDGPNSYQDSLSPEAPNVPGAQEVPRPSTRPPGMRESPRAPIASPQSRPQTQFSTGAAYGAEAAPRGLPLPLRIGVRISLGAMLFLVFAAVRHCHAFDREVDSALARWNTHDPAPDTEPSAAGRASGHDALGPLAREWMKPELHTFTNGDKDRVASLVSRFENAGSSGVHIGRLAQSGVIQVAAELVVELPSEPDKRKAVFAEYYAFLRGAFGDFAEVPTDNGGDVLRVAL